MPVKLKCGIHGLKGCVCFISIGLPFIFQCELFYSLNGSLKQLHKLPCRYEIALGRSNFLTYISRVK